MGFDTSLTGGFIAANYGVAIVRQRSPWVRPTVEGSPALLINDGKFVTKNLRREGIDEDEVLMAIREHGIAGVRDVRMAVLEIDGAISIVPADATPMRTRRHPRFTKRGA